MENLLQETRREIEASGHTPADIVFIGSRRSGHSCTWDEFETLADVEYDDGYGSAEVAGDLEIIFSDGAFMHRGEYDGSEWWAYWPSFRAPEVTRPIRRLTSVRYEDTLAEIDAALDKVES
jgi:hypothetical protein